MKTAVVTTVVIAVLGIIAHFVVSHPVMILSFFIGIPTTLVIVVPVLAFLRLATGWKRWWAYATAGALCGIPFAAAAVWLWLYHVSRLDCGDFAKVPLFCRGSMIVLTHLAALAAGIIVAGAFNGYIVWHTRRHDLDRASTRLQQPLGGVERNRVEGT